MLINNHIGEESKNRGTDYRNGWSLESEIIQNCP